MVMIMEERMTLGRSRFINREVRIIDKDIVDYVLEELRHYVFAGFFKDADDGFAGMDADVAADNAMIELKGLIARALIIYGAQDTAGGYRKAEALTADFRAALGDMVKQLHDDVKAAYDGDPAASGYKEIILAYPGMYAVFVHRVAHMLYELDVPLLPRLMSEIAHGRTGIDIHPGASIGGGFFIDHGTGIVVGETAVIGRNVKMYHGVTLGALTTRKARKLSGTKRHPTVGNDVTLYANAVVLGGDTVVGDGSTVSGGALVTQSIGTGSRV